MKFQILSDQHLELAKNLDFFNDSFFPEADNLLIAGDFYSHNLSFDRDKIIRDKILPNWKNTVIIPGNHDFYCFSNLNCTNINASRFCSFLDVIEDSGNSVYYGNNVVVNISGVNIVCSSLWSYIDPIDAYYFNNRMNDFRCIPNFDVDLVNSLYDESVLFLRDYFSSCVSSRNIVLSHNLPSYSLISDRWRGNDVNCYFASNLDDFICDYSDLIPFWVHGHSHDFIDTSILNTRFIRNPMGHPHERNCILDFTIDV
jgi:hypothetical protein